MDSLKSYDVMLRRMKSAGRNPDSKPSPQKAFSNSDVSSVNKIRYFRIKSDFEKVFDLCEVIFIEFNEIGIEQQLNINLRLALAEALNNIVEHAYEMNDDQYIKIFVNIFNDKLRFIIKDNGRENKHGIDPVELNITSADRENVPEGGYGFNIIDQIMDRIEYYREGHENTIVLEKWLV